ncbi:MAG: PilZ domain-containing protein [Candidatus Omnitrophica bacterium]|nr:PilZ domain-containing protein [Candidatus Omnitrophota bacterium]MCF7877018.1 PilZ domain-containing protein [Candidatus Omnitrophota bacterium]MCF7878359.1 PilZ domain-containing protein [Candidatus Omnitrophota bacterium]MCF7893033.1 PilZ domain-containing protein [Candidatus Omnitrophota bacterium]
MKEFEDKRRCIRYKAPFCFDCRYPGFREVLSGALKDISFQGACLLVDSQKDLSREEVASLSLIFPETTLDVKAKIVWQKKAGDKNKVGVSFLNLPDSFKDNIYNSVFKHYRKEITSKWWDF